MNMSDELRGQTRHPSSEYELATPDRNLFHLGQYLVAGERYRYLWVSALSEWDGDGVSLIT